MCRPATQKHAFVLANLAGSKTDLTAYRGKPVLVHFFATWCEPCREELPALQRLVDRSGEAPVMVMAISVGEVELRVRRFFKDMAITYPVLLDSDRAVARAWEVHALPTTYVLDAALTPRLFAERDLAWDKLDLDRLLERLSAGDQPPVQSIQQED